MKTNVPSRTLAPSLPTVSTSLEPSSVNVELASPEMVSFAMTSTSVSPTAAGVTHWHSAKTLSEVTSARATLVMTEVDLNAATLMNVTSAPAVAVPPALTVSTRLADSSVTVRCITAKTKMEAAWTRMNARWLLIHAPTRPIASTRMKGTVVHVKMDTKATAISARTWTSV